MIGIGGNVHRVEPGRPVQDRLKTVGFTIAAFVSMSLGGWLVSLHPSDYIPALLTLIPGVVLIVIGALWPISKAVSALVPVTVPKVGKWVKGNARRATMTIVTRTIRRVRLLLFGAIGSSAALFISIIIMYAQGKKGAAVALGLLLVIVLIGMIALRTWQTRPEPVPKGMLAVDSDKVARKAGCECMVWAPSDHNVWGGDQLLGWRMSALMWKPMDGMRRWNVWGVVRPMSYGFAPVLVPCVVEADGDSIRMVTCLEADVPEDAVRQGYAIGLDVMALSDSDTEGVGVPAGGGMNDPRAPKWDSGVVTLYDNHDGVCSDVVNAVNPKSLPKPGYVESMRTAISWLSGLVIMALLSALLVLSN